MSDSQWAAASFLLEEVIREMPRDREPVRDDSDPFLATRQPTMGEFGSSLTPWALWADHLRTPPVIL
jgi:hypothetical protein